MAFYPQLDLITIGTNGYSVMMPGEDVTITNLDSDVSPITVTSTADGIIEAGAMAGNEGDLVELSHATYPEILRLRLGVSIEAAGSLNRACTYLLEDTYMTVPAKLVDVYLQDRNAPNGTPQLVGTAPVNSSLKIPAQSNILKTMRLFPLGGEGNRPIVSFDTDNYTDVSIRPTSISRTLFDHVEDATTTGSTLEEALYTDTIDGLTLFYTGDKIVAEYAGVFEANANDKQIRLYFDSILVFDSGIIIEDGTHWKLNATMTRVADTTLRVVAYFASSVPWEPVYTEVTGISLFDPNDLVITAQDSEHAEDTTAKMGYGLFIPSSGTDTDYVTYLGEIVTYGGEPVTYP